MDHSDHIFLSRIFRFYEVVSIWNGIYWGVAAYLHDNRLEENEMNHRILNIFLFVVIALSGCRNEESEKYSRSIRPTDSSITGLSENTILTGNTRPEILVAYAKTLLETPYLYASADPSAGFDCSGFITYVFNHFHIKVPRSSVDFTNQGKQVFLENAKPGDLILFTGTDSSTRRVGHMGIIVSNFEGGIQFIHSTSGGARAVVITPMENYYKSRFVKVIRVFPDSFF